MPAPTTPTDIVNRALDECGVPAIDDIADGSPQGRAAIRIYDPTLRELLAGAHWNFARKQEDLVLLADIGGQYSNSTAVIGPWSFMYEWPVTAVHARFVPRTDPFATAVNGTPIFPNQTAVATAPAWSSPAPFLVASADFPNPIGSQWYLTEGHDPDQTRVILTNQLNAQLVYTAMMQYPDAWDPLFTQAMVATLAAKLAMPVVPDKREARLIRSDNIAIARAALNAARVRDGNEGWTVADHTPDWIRARTSGACWDGPGMLWYPWMSVPFIEDAGGVY